MDLNGQGRYELAVAIVVIMCIYDVIKAFIYVIKHYVLPRMDRAVQRAVQVNNADDNLFNIVERTPPKIPKKVRVRLKKLKKLSTNVGETMEQDQDMRLGQVDECRGYLEGDIQCRSPSSSIGMCSEITKKWKERMKTQREKEQGILIKDALKKRSSLSLELELACAKVAKFHSASTPSTPVDKNRPSLVSRKYSTGNLKYLRLRMPSTASDSTCTSMDKGDGSGWTTPVLQA